MNQTNNFPVSGVIIPLVTPFTDSLELDEPALRQQVQRCASAGVGAVFVGGSAGSGPLLTDSQWRRAAEVAVEAAAEAGTHAMLGVIATSTARALEQIRFSQELGVETIVVTPTYYIALQRDAEVLAHFGACREATDQHLIIYNIPGCTGCQISVAAMGEMMGRGWGAAVKESSGDAAYFRQVLALGEEHSVGVFQGNEVDIVWSLQAGAAGIVPVCGNYDPGLFVDIDARVRRSGEAAADDQTRINALRDVLLVGDHNWIAGITWGVHTMGLGSGRPPLPLQPVDAERKRMIEGLNVSGGAAKAPVK